MLCGNKCDLESAREVTTAEGYALAATWKCPFFETSAKAKINNETCFFQVVREIREMEKKVTPGSTQRKKRCAIL